MSLSKQLVVLLSVLFLLIFSINFALSVKNTKTYLEGEASIHAQDTATSLGLSLSPYMENERDPVIASMIQAIFDRGYYREISLVNVDKVPLLTLKDDHAIRGVPDWFIEFLPMRLAKAESEISTGWQITGTVSVTVNPGYAYRKLYQQVKTAFYYSASIFVVSLALLLLSVRVVLRSLKRIEQMAMTLADGRFSTIDHIPWTSEARNLTLAMNSMSTKLAAYVDKLQHKLSSMGDKLLRDDLTGLHQKAVFETDMKKLFMEDSEAFIYIVRLDSLSSLVKEQGDETIERFLKDCASMLEHFCTQYPEDAASCYRFYGAEFVLLIKGIDIEQARRGAERLSESFAGLGQRYRKKDIVHIGVTPFCSVTTTEMLLEAAHEAYEQARMIGTNSSFVRADHQPARNMAEWKTLVFECVDKKRYQLEYIGYRTAQNKNVLLMEEVLTQAFDTDGEALTMATFIAITEEFDKIVELETDVTRSILERIRQPDCRHALAVNLSTRTVKSAEFRRWLGEQLKNRPAEAERLVFSLTAYAVAKEADVYRNFIEFAHELGAKAMIKRFAPQTMPVSLCTAVKPDYIRLSRELGHHIAQNEEKQEFVKTLAEVGEVLDIILLAESIDSDADYEILQGLGIAGASR